ncbi:hypothetical protein [Roseateles amylovorans]|uniref:Uncharacterized protein n=1 Tax=Roseateles amylovorans TaxID=2978473 RepID=A0ABY6B5U2_9BURK|nr:hypothetical protein [Roseateles amylovorans]UXH80743.1 hypothetical protein N4261_13050 [Roseateles amylovorans]
MSTGLGLSIADAADTVTPLRIGNPAHSRAASFTGAQILPRKVAIQESPVWRPV